MSNRYLSQEEIDAILKGGSNPEPESLSAVQIDALGEVGNISMGTAATTLSQLLNQRVTITTPRVVVLQKEELFDQFKVPYLSIMVNYTEGLTGFNLLVIKTTDAALIADLMMGGKGDPASGALDEIQLSAVAEVMNQMIGSAATSMYSLFSRKVNISPPEVVLFDSPPDAGIFPELNGEALVVVFFKMVIGNIIDSEILQVMPLRSAKQMVDFLMGGSLASAASQAVPEHSSAERRRRPEYQRPTNSYPEPVNVQKAQFSQLPPPPISVPGANIEIILDVQLQVSVVLGKSRKSIKDILTLGSGSVVELDRMVEDQVDVLVNGTLIAKGEIVVVNENFGVRLTSVLSQADRLKELNRGK
ncbi:MAG: flagellar motor switch protein FliN/FliY [Bacillota bacterium]|nr:MAG: flagellar motor switch protein FliN/FliY [Bacillota bacterium]